MGDTKMTSSGAGRGRQRYEGKAKILFEIQGRPGLMMVYKDDATAGNGAKRGTIQGKGQINARLTAALFQYLEHNGVKTHFVEQLSADTLLVDELEMIPLEVVVRNRVTGSLQRRTGLPEGSRLEAPLVEFYFKKDELGDPLLTPDHILLLGVASAEQLEALRQAGLRVNELLLEVAGRAGLSLVDFKLEFGWRDGQLVLGDEISPDTSRFWDLETSRKLDKDRFRQDLGGVEEAYMEVQSRLLGALQAMGVDSE